MTTGINAEGRVFNSNSGPITAESIVRMLGEESGKCISCGFCDSVCPTYAPSGNDPVITARGRAQLGKRLYDDVSLNGSSDLIVGDSFYSCLDCHACLEICPTGVDSGKISDLGKMLIAEGNFISTNQERPEARMVVSATMKYGNPMGVREKCAEWAKGLVFDSESSTLLYTGNMYQLMAYSTEMKERREKIGPFLSRLMAGLAASFPWIVRAGNRKFHDGTMEIMNRSLRNITELLRLSKVEFDYLGEDEPYPGTFIHDLGYYENFRVYSNRVAEIFRNRGYRRIITTDPHTYVLLKDVYPRFVKNFNFEAVYYLDLIDSRLLSKTEENVVFHEPCHFVLSKDEYSRPKELLSGIANVTMPARSGRKTHCCGGPDELLFGDLSEGISRERFRQLREAGKGRIVTSCPICFINLSKDGHITDISNILYDAASGGIMPS